MLKRTVLLSILTACFTAMAFGQKPAPKQAVTEIKKEADIKAAIIKLEDANNAAVLKGDGATLGALYADDFTGINAAGGKSSKTDMVSFYSSNKTVMAVHATDEVVVRVIDKAVIVTARLKYQYNETYEDRSVKWMRYTRIYARRGAAWLIVAEHYCFTPAPEAQ